MEESFEKKCAEIKKIFAPLTPDQRYDKLMELGRALPPFPEELKTAQHLVPGCQSTLYLASRMENGQLFFAAHADALISAGLAALLIQAYSGESPETLLKSPPTFLAELGLTLSPNRSNGLGHIHLRMKQEAVKYLVEVKR